MRHFHSYGPTDPQRHFTVDRAQLVNRCCDYLVGDLEKGGHYFTIWAPRQSGKTWLMLQMKEAVAQRYGERFEVRMLSLEGLRDMVFPPESQSEPDGVPRALNGELKEAFPDQVPIHTWEDFRNLFSKTSGVLDRPLLLLIDEVDCFDARLLTQLAGQFRKLFLNRTPHYLHGLALIGVRAVVGLESHTESPFNVQRSFHIPNFTLEEVQELFQQYQEEREQVVAADVVQKTFEATNGQPGLVGWLGELLTDTYNDNPSQPIGLKSWRHVYRQATTALPNNTLTYMISKASLPEYHEFLLALFSNEEIPFAFHDPHHNYLYMHGVLGFQQKADAKGERINICRFASPFVQKCLFDALHRDLRRSGLLGQGQTAPLDLTDLPADWINPDRIDLPAILQAYRRYLQRLNEAGQDPWKQQPQRTNLNVTEAVGHFHLYAWLTNALNGFATVSPEFPTGNGQVDLSISTQQTQAIIEVKSFSNVSKLKASQQQAARYAHQLGLDEVMLVVYAPLFPQQRVDAFCGEMHADVEDEFRIRVYVEVIGQLSM